MERKTRKDEMDADLENVPLSLIYLINNAMQGIFVKQMRQVDHAVLCDCKVHRMQAKRTTDWWGVKMPTKEQAQKNLQKK